MIEYEPTAMPPLLCLLIGALLGILATLAAGAAWCFVKYAGATKRGPT